ncbi:dihydroxy-acid dehydratase, partial [Acinetobacter baumannii]
FTANTMAVALECMGLAPLGTSLVDAVDLESRTVTARHVGGLAVERARSGVGARSFMSRAALEHAMAGIVATGGSTNGLLHLLAIAREAGVP